MKLLAINGSMRKDSNTFSLIKSAVDNIKRLHPDVETEILQISEMNIHPCKVICSGYCSSNPYQCSILDDSRMVLNKMIETDVILLGAPLYFRAPPAKFCLLAERLVSMFYFAESKGGARLVSPISKHICGLIGTAEYSNPHQILEYLHDFCNVIGISPIRLEKFPYLGAAGQGSIENDLIFYPFERLKELAEKIVDAYKQVPENKDQN